MSQEQETGRHEWSCGKTAREQPERQQQQSRWSVQDQKQGSARRLSQSITVDCDINRIPCAVKSLEDKTHNNRDYGHHDGKNADHQKHLADRGFIFLLPVSFLFSHSPALIVLMADSIKLDSGHIVDRDQSYCRASGMTCVTTQSSCPLKSLTAMRSPVFVCAALVRLRPSAPVTME